MFVTKPSVKAKTDSSFYQVTDSIQYHIRKNDKLNISIWNNDDISVGSISVSIIPVKVMESG